MAGTVFTKDSIGWRRIQADVAMERRERRQDRTWGVVVAFLLVLGAFTALGCDQRPELRAEVAALESQRAALEDRAGRLQGVVEVLESRIGALRTDETVMLGLKSGREVRFVLRLKIRQVHYSIDISQHLSDSMNAEEFSIYTDRATYESAVVGSDFFEAFRAGSAIMKGSFGSWKLVVVSKATEASGQ